MSHLNFVDDEITYPGRKTKSFQVRSAHSNDMLGMVRWYAPWRRYIFRPEACVLDADCLRDVAAFCEKLMRERNATGMKP